VTFSEGTFETVGRVKQPIGSGEGERMTARTDMSVMLEENF
jgi:hypothetical protein